MRTVCVVVEGAFYSDNVFPDSVFSDEELAKDQACKDGFTPNKDNADSYLYSHPKRKVYRKFFTVPFLGCQTALLLQ